MGLLHLANVFTHPPCHLTPAPLSLNNFLLKRHIHITTYLPPPPPQMGEKHSRFWHWVQSNHCQTTHLQTAWCHHRNRCVHAALVFQCRFALLSLTPAKMNKVLKHREWFSLHMQSELKIYIKITDFSHIYADYLIYCTASADISDC